MVSLTCIYTRGGDKGQTSLGDGSRVDKSSLRIEVLGSLDEANSAIGLAMVAIHRKERSCLEKVQHELFDLGAELCQPGSAARISAGQIECLEREIDSMNRRLPPLDSFVLPGGNEASAYLHLARAIVRRTERSVVELSDLELVSDTALGYINRLSDYLFVMARLHSQGEQEILWIPRLGIPKLGRLLAGLRSRKRAPATAR